MVSGLAKCCSSEDLTVCIVPESVRKVTALDFSLLFRLLLLFSEDFLRWVFLMLVPDV